MLSWEEDKGSYKRKQVRCSSSRKSQEKALGGNVALETAGFSLLATDGRDSLILL